MSELTIADVSEHQGAVDWPAYVAAGNTAAIVRAYNGSRPDNRWPANRDAFHDSGGRVLGIYAYVTGRDIRAQAEAFATLLGSLRPGEFPIMDLEEGTGDVAGRGAVWREVVTERLGGTVPWIYSGQYFYRDNNLVRAGFPANRTWIAAYSSARPGWPDHAMWQYTDHHNPPMPGIRAPHDASKFYGSIDDLADLVGSAGPVADPTGNGRRDGTRTPFPGADKFGPGQSNEYVTMLGEMLVRAGYARFYTVGPGPKWGSADQAATKAFQIAQGWTGSGADGIPGPRTWELLRAAAR